MTRIYTTVMEQDMPRVRTENIAHRHFDRYSDVSDTITLEINDLKQICTKLVIGNNVYHLMYVTL